MRHAPWSIALSAVAFSALVAIGGTPVGGVSLDAGVPLLAGLFGTAYVGALLVGRFLRRQPTPARAVTQPRRIGGPRVF
jgi:hypothetical protein